MVNVLRNTRIGIRLALGFGVLLALVATIIVLGILGLQSLNAKSESIAKSEWPKIKLAMDALDNTRGSMARVFQLTLVSDDGDAEAATDRFDANVKGFDEPLDKLGALLVQPEAKELLARCKAGRDLYVNSARQVMKLTAGGKREEGVRLAMLETYPALHLFAGDLRKLNEQLRSRVDATALESRATFEEIRRNLILLGVVALVLGVGIAWWLTRGITRPLAKAVKVANAIAIGKLDGHIEVRSADETGQLLASMQKMTQAVQALVADATMLSEAAVAGRLSVRADLSRHQGDFHRVVEGVNRTLDAVIGPLNVAASYVDQIARGAIPAKITDEYSGDFNAIKNNLNVCIDAVNALVADTQALSAAAVEGRLSARAELAHHQGDFRRIVEGVNATLDAIVGPVNEVVRLLGALSRGDLTEKITERYQGTFDQLAGDVNLTVEQLAGIVTRIKDAAESIKVASGEIAAGNTDLSSRTEEQASSLEETAASMEELTATVNQNADSARAANELAANASAVAVRGGAVVGEVVTTMNSINDSSKKIADIIGVIDGIAFQTNILALNAAVEAARAGEQGRGFAVVAAEVRNLAQRSAAAAKEIKSLIDDSVQKVGAGTRQVGEAGRTMEEIVVSVRRVTDIMAGIAAASQEQSAGIGQVNTAIAQMDDVTQQNAALVEQAAASTASMEAQAAQLVAAVATFKLAARAGWSAESAAQDDEAVAAPAAARCAA